MTYRLLLMLAIKVSGSCAVLLQEQTNRSSESMQSARAEGKFTLPSGRAAMWLIAGMEQLDEEDKQPRVCCRT
jgi:beta-lactamase class A